ncbi:MAG: serine--tRNA ligase, partial [Verrucomicrobiales bacterium]|nr:serine--tRNA ligase [Verrucomicrobiales bacterium]
MLDIRQLREDPEAIKTRLKARGGEAWILIDEILSCDEKRRAGETEKQQLQSDRNRISKEIGALRKEGKDASAIESRVREIGERIKAIGEEADTAEARQIELLLQVPNLPHADCPVGSDETANPVVREWGTKPTFAFETKDHVEIGARLGLF